jgi:hypothetical protein
MLSFLLKFTLVPNSALLFLKLLVFEFRLGISETSGYSALVPHANSPSARFASATNDICRDVDVFAARHVLLNYLF